MALHESPTMALHGLSVQFCFVVVAFFVTVHVLVAILLWSALAEGLRVDAIVWLLQHLELFVSSFLPLGFQGCSPTEACSRHCRQSRHSRLSHAYTDRPVCVSGGAILCSSVPHAAQQQARSAAWSPLANLHRALCHCCRFTALSQLFTWHFSRLDTFCTSSHTFDTGFLLLDVVHPTRLCQPRVACFRHQMLLIC